LTWKGKNPVKAASPGGFSVVCAAAKVAAKTNDMAEVGDLVGANGRLPRLTGGCQQNWANPPRANITRVSASNLIASDRVAPYITQGRKS
jgi:hypothetical protein